MRKKQKERGRERERGEKSWQRMRELSETRPFFDHVDTMWTRRRKLPIPQQSGTSGIASFLSSSYSHKQLCHSAQRFLRTLRNIFSKCQVSPAPSRLMCQRFLFCFVFFFNLGSSWSDLWRVNNMSMCLRSSQIAHLAREQTSHAFSTDLLSCCRGYLHNVAAEDLQIAGLTREKQSRVLAEVTSIIFNLKICALDNFAGGHR